MTKIIARSFDAGVVEDLSSNGIPPALARILAARGIAKASQLESSLVNLIPPEQLTNNTQMAVLLADAIAANKSLLVIGDYDCDGATATAVAVRGLRSMGAKVDYLVPNRFEYGYGLTPEIVALAAERKPDIIITVDNGIASVEGVAAANTLGIQVLVTDHHLPADETPQAACIVNPNQHGCDFPSKNLAGVGVIFYVMLALRAELRKRGVYESKPEPNLTELLDIVALGTVADLVKLDDNNRILVDQGLRRIRAGKSPFSSDKEHLHHRIMRAGNTQQRTAFIMYLWTATIAFPVTVLAFAPIWVAALVATTLLLITTIFSRGRSKMYPHGKPEVETVNVE